MTDKEINTLVQQHVVHIIPEHRWCETSGGDDYCAYCGLEKWQDERLCCGPQYTHDANEVITLLQAQPDVLFECYYISHPVYNGPEKWGVSLRYRGVGPDRYERGVDLKQVHTKADTLGRALCLTLLKYHGVEVET